MRIEPQGFFREIRTHLLYGREIYFMQFRSNDMYSSMLFLKSSYILSRIVHTETVIDQTIRQAVASKRSKTMENY